MQPRHFVFQHAALTFRAFISPEKEKDISGYFHLRLGLGAAQKGPKRVIAALCGHWLASFGQMTNRVELNIFNICSKLPKKSYFDQLFHPLTLVFPFSLAKDQSRGENSLVIHI